MFDPLRELIRAESSITLTPPSSVMGAIIGRRYWIRSGEHRLEFSRLFFSENWHRGGVNHTNIYSNQRVNVNYRKDDVHFNNTFIWRLGLNSTPDDTLRNYNINNDLLRYEGSFGINAFFGRGWVYSTNAWVETRLFNEYRINSSDVRSAFLAPLRGNVGIGLGYGLDRRSETVRHRRLRIEGTNFNPISLGFIFVNNPDLAQRHGVEEGKKWELTPGMSLNSRMIYDFNRFITWTARFHYFTGFSNVLAELDNRLVMHLTNAFTTTIEINLRYDDSRPPDDTFGHLQINQMLRFGLRYTW
jgi:hypothetical protein